MQEKMGHSRTESQEGRWSPLPLCVSLAHPVLSCTHYFQAPDAQAMTRSE